MKTKVMNLRREIATVLGVVVVTLVVLYVAVGTACLKTKVMNLRREIATGLGVVVVTLVVLYVAVGAACLILGLCIHLSSDLFANYFGLAILTAAWIVVGLVYLVVCALSNLWDWWDQRPNL
jgi:hypothetical protein